MQALSALQRMISRPSWSDAALGAREEDENRATSGLSCSAY